MKKYRIFWLVLVLSLLWSAAALAADFGVVYGADMLNLRSQGSSSSQWLGSYPRGTWVEIVGSQNNFYRVITPDGRTGYMSKNYIDAYDEKTWTLIVDNSNGGAFLNFRAAPSYQAQVLDIFYYGVPLQATDLTYDGWYAVRIGGRSGYVRSEYVTDMHYNYAGSEDVYTIKTPGNTALNLRTGPGMQYGVVRQFPGDRYVMVLARGKGWSRVCVDGYVGYMSNDYLVEGLHSARDNAADAGGGAGSTAYAQVNNPISTQTLNLRQSPSTASLVLDKLRNGTRLWVDEQGTEWCAVTDQSTGLSGYVMTRYIRLYNLPSTPKRRVTHPYGSFVNLRSAPDMTKNNVIISLNHGTEVTILAPGPDWCKVSYMNATGYMLTCFLK